MEGMWGKGGGGGRNWEGKGGYSSTISTIESYLYQLCLHTTSRNWYASYDAYSSIIILSFQLLCVVF